MTTYAKIADLSVNDGKYQKEGREYVRHQKIGAIVSTPHGSHMFIKLYATATSDSRIINIDRLPGIQIQVVDNTDVLPGA